MSYRLLIKAAALATTCWMSVSTALAENRMALVIGNSDYRTVTALPNPANDARAMAKFLISAGFQVMQAPNLTQSDMRKTIGNFASMVGEKGPDTVALVFYAGHGLQVDGENYLVPVDASIQREADVPLQATRLADVMNALAAVPLKARLVILDACRNNPFSDINKTSGRGLAIVDAPTGSLVSYSTGPGMEALDGDGANSPFTAALTKVGQEQGVPIEQALKRVRLAVNDATNRQQTPWESSSLTSEFSFFPGATSSSGVHLASAGAATAPAAARQDTRSVETWQKELKSHTPREAYEIVVREDQVEAYQAYLTLYPAQSLAPVVRTLVERRREMIAWHDAVTINSVVSYQTFLSTYGNSDIAATAERLIARAKTRSVSNAFSAYASAAAGPTCPCSQPTNATPRQKRADLTPADNPAPASVSSGPVAIATPPLVVTDPIVPPPVIVTPLPPRVHLPPRHDGDKPWGDKPTGGKPTGSYPTGDKPTAGKGGDTPTRGTGTPTRGIDKPKLTRFTNDSPRIRNLAATNRLTRMDKPAITRTTLVKPRMTPGLAPRGMMMGRPVMMGRPRLGFMGGRRFF